MRKNTKIIGAVIAVVVIVSAGLYVVRPEQLDGIMPWDEIDAAIDGFWKMDFWINTTIGDFFLSEVVSSNALSITYAGAEVTEVAYVILAKAITPSEADPWDTVRISLANPPPSDELNVFGVIRTMTSVTKWSQTMYPGTTESTSWDDIILTVDSPAYKQIFKWTIDIVGIAGEFTPDVYRISFDVDGTVAFRGESGSELGDWTIVNLDAYAMNALFDVVEDITYGLIVTWNQDIQWTYV